MYIPTDLPKRKPTLTPYHYDTLAECKAFDVNMASELTEMLIDAIYAYTTNDLYNRYTEILTISDTLLGEDCYSINIARRYSPKDYIEYITIECWDNREHDFMYFINLRDDTFTSIRFQENDLPDVFDIIDFVIRIDEMIATEIDWTEQAREDIVEMRALVYGEGW